MLVLNILSYFIICLLPCHFHISYSPDYSSRRSYLTVGFFVVTFIRLAHYLVFSSVTGRKVSLCSLRIPGVLQRLAVSYLVVAVTEIIFVQETNVHQVAFFGSNSRHLLAHLNKHVLTINVMHTFKRFSL